MKEKGFTTVKQLGDEVNRLREIVVNPQKIEPLKLKDHTEINIVRIADFIQTEGTISYSHDPYDRMWIPVIGIGMAIEEPMKYTGRLVSAYVVHSKVGGGM